MDLIGGGYRVEDQRVEEAWWQNEIRSGRDPSKGYGCPFDNNGTPLRFRPVCSRPAPKKELTDILVEATAQHFGIESEEEKCNLKIMFDAYAQFKMQESPIKAFSSHAKEGAQECGEERTKS